MNTTSAMELEPWLVIQTDEQRRTPALWRLQTSSAVAVAIFSDRARAEAYAAQNISGAADVIQPQRIDLLKLLVECFRQGVTYAALDPNSTAAASLFELREVLSAARRELKAM